MDLSRFFSGLNWKRSMYDNFYIIGGEHDAEYVCAYKHRDGAKKSIITLTNAILKIKKDPREFDFHHIVEKQHIADICWNGQLDRAYELEIPTVLIHNVRHKKTYDSILHAQQTRPIYTNGDTRRLSIMERKSEAVKLYCTDNGRRKLKERALTMKGLYSGVYSNEPALRTLAMNVLNHYVQALSW